MKRTLGILLVVFMLLGAGCVPTEKSLAPQNIFWSPDAEPDFDGLYWGNSPVEVRERLGKTLNENEGFYTVDGGSFGDISCWKTFTFNGDNQLYKVGVNFYDVVDSTVLNLNEYLTELYGEPEASEYIADTFKDYDYVYHNSERTLISLTHVKSATGDLVWITAEYSDVGAGS